MINNMQFTSKEYYKHFDLKTSLCENKILQYEVIHHHRDTQRKYKIKPMILHSCYYNAKHIFAVIIVWETEQKINKEENNDSRKRRVCKFGCGVETTHRKCDTPGFRQRESNSIVTDLRGYTRLELKRQSKRILQSSIYALQSWRANCDC